MFSLFSCQTFRSEMRGFWISEHPLPIIALNGSEFPRGKLFTLLHELTHILLHRSGICDLEDVTVATESESQRLEWYCNSVAAAALMPRDSVRRMVRAFEASSNKRWTDDELLELSGSFGVSKEAMLVRLVSLGYATREYYKERRPVFLEQYQEQRINSTGFLTTIRSRFEIWDGGIFVPFGMRTNEAISLTLS